MATFSKKINILKSGTTYKVNVYSTSGEAGSSFTGAIIIDGTQGYYPLCGTSDSRATPGRCLHSNGTTYALATDGVPAYAYKYITAVGSGTFTVPKGVTKLRVTCVGGGAGGVATIWFNDNTADLNETRNTVDGIKKLFGMAPTNNKVYYSASAGGKTTFGSVTANGATYAVCNLTAISWTEKGSRDTTYSYSGYYPTSATASKGTTNGGIGVGRGYDGADGAPAVVITNMNGTQIGKVGAGGKADSHHGYASAGASGYKTTTTITVTPASTISYTVGKGGNGRDRGTVVTSGYRHENDSGTGAGVGSSGGILVEWGKGVQ
jgi:hypothetical protein